MRRLLIAVVLLIALALGLRYSTSPETRLFALDAASGRVIWSAIAPEGAARLGTPVVAHGRVVVEAGGGGAPWSLVAFDAASGKRLWTVTPQTISAGSVDELDTLPIAPYVTTDSVFAHVVVDDDGEANSRLIALDAARGTLRWAVDRPWSSSAHTPGVSGLDNQVYVLAPSSRDRTSLTARDTATGQVSWQVELDQPATIEGKDSELVAVRDRVIVRAPGGPARAYDRATGAMQFALEGTGKQLELYESTLYQLDTGTISALDVTNGREQWRYTLEEATCGGTTGFLTRMRAHADVLYAGCMRLDGSNDAGGYIMVIDTSIGHERWRRQVTRYGMSLLFQAPAASGDAVYVNGQSPTTSAPGLVALSAADGTERWHFPKQLSNDTVTTDGARVFSSDRAPRWRHWLRQFHLQ